MAKKATHPRSHAPRGNEGKSPPGPCRGKAYVKLAVVLSEDSPKFGLEALSKLSEGFSGAEIEEAIISGLYDAFSQGGDLDTAILRTGSPRPCRCRGP